MSVMPDVPHDELDCGLWRDEQAPCTAAAVVSVIDAGGEAVWGCEAHAARALDAIDGEGQQPRSERNVRRRAGTASPPQLALAHERSHL